MEVGGSFLIAGIFEGKGFQADFVSVKCTSLRGALNGLVFHPNSFFFRMCCTGTFSNLNECSKMNKSHMHQLQREKTVLLSTVSLQALSIKIASRGIDFCQRCPWSRACIRSASSVLAECIFPLAGDNKKERAVRWGLCSENSYDCREISQSFAARVS